MILVFHIHNSIIGSNITMSQVLFTPPTSAFEPSFWESLYHKKLNVFRLDTAPVEVRAEIIPGDDREQGCMKFNGNSFEVDSSKVLSSVNGKLINVNKIEEFSTFDKKKLIIDAGHHILGLMAKGDAIRNPSLLNQFYLLSFADLKSYKFVFWFAQPALSLKDSMHVASPFTQFRSTSEPTAAAEEEFLRAAYSYLEKCTADGAEMPTVFAVRDRHAEKVFPGEQDATTRPIPDLFGEDAVVIDSDFSSSTAEAAPAYVDNGRWEALSLFDAWPYRYDSASLRFVCLDQSNQMTSLGWTTRNFLTLLALYGTQDRASYFLSSLFFKEWQQEQKLQQQLEEAGNLPPAPPASKTVTIVALRNPALRKMNAASSAWNIDQLANQDCSVWGKVSVPVLSLPHQFDVSGRLDIPLLAKTLFPTDHNVMSIVGWEPNERGKAGPRVADLRASLDTRLLMSQAVDLNLRLMKWRQWPSLQVDQLRQQKCLLLGSGTLGCAVARALMGWGIRHLTFVDNGRVAYSNPVRQCLFTYEDAQHGKYKATAAAEQVVKIFPDMHVQAELIAIPMPGHSYASATAGPVDGNQQQTVLSDEAARQRLDELVQSHDIVFNLTDSREARWLPTVLCRVHNKLCINAALGFDSYLVMHHGQPANHSNSNIDNTDGTDSDQADDNGNSNGNESNTAGCYFCSDIVAAGNSQRDRTLDEQCTVTRPGLSFIAAALCAELLVALLHNNNGNNNVQEEDTNVHYDTVDAATGASTAPPHQIRGNVLGFTQMCLESPVFPCCTACSAAVIDAYRAGPTTFVQQVAANPQYLETLSGIAAMVQDIDVQLCIDSDEEF